MMGLSEESITRNSKAPWLTISMGFKSADMGDGAGPCREILSRPVIPQPYGLVSVHIKLGDNGSDSEARDQT